MFMMLTVVVTVADMVMVIVADMVMVIVADWSWS